VDLRDGKRNARSAAERSSIRFQFGRCSVRRHFPAAIAILKDKSDLFKNFVEHVVGFDEAVDYYRRFEKNEVGKTVFITEAGRAARGGQ
jgi:threonine dehydrogenase-like Zn-dependent dehydrogenase